MRQVQSKVDGLTLLNRLWVQIPPTAPLIEVPPKWAGNRPKWKSLWYAYSTIRGFNSLLFHPSQVDRDSQQMTVKLWVFTTNRTLLSLRGNTRRKSARESNRRATDSPSRNQRQWLAKSAMGNKLAFVVSSHVGTRGSTPQFPQLRLCQCHCRPQPTA